jgi:hypothetical protein
LSVVEADRDLAGKNVEEETRLQMESIENADAELERGQKAINELLGSMDGAEYVGPRAPNLPGVTRSMDAHEFTLAAFQSLGAQLTPKGDGLYLAEENGGREYIRSEETAGSEVKSTLYAAGSAAFQPTTSTVIRPRGPRRSPGNGCRLSAPNPRRRTFRKLGGASTARLCSVRAPP